MKGIPQTQKIKTKTKKQKTKQLNAKKLELIQWIAEIEDMAVLENLLKIKNESAKNESVNNGNIVENIVLDKDKSYYSLEDLQKISQQFPIDKKWNFDDLSLHFPQNLKHKVEILNNKLLIMAAPSFIHQKISMKLSRELSFFVENNNLGEILTAPIDTKLDDDNGVQPDILFIAITRYQIIKENYIDGAPDMVVEIWSPSNKKKERNAKHDLYEQKGVKEYWTIFPKKREIIVEVLENNQYKIFSKGKKNGVIQSSVLNGFEIKIEEIMPESLFEQK